MHNMTKKERLAWFIGASLMRRRDKMSIKESPLAILLVPDEEGEISTGNVAQIAAGSWSCALCGVLNDPVPTKCRICHAPKIDLDVSDILIY